jgi:cytochrome P450
MIERVLAVCVFGYAAWPILRLCSIRAFWRKLRAFPNLIAALFTLLIGYILVIGYLGLYAPTYFRLAAILTGGALIYTHWRARPGYGHSRNLPPGSLALAPIEPWLDHLFYQKRAARYGPVFKTSNVTQPMICVVGLKEILELLRSHDQVLGIPPLPFSRFIPKGFLRYMASADHTVYSPIFRSGFSRVVIQKCEPFAARTVRQELSRMAECSTKDSAGGAHPEPFIDRMLFIIFARVFFGILPETDCFAKLQSLYRVMDYRRAWRTPRRKVIKALNEATAVIQQQVTRQSRAERPDEDASGCFLEEIIKADPRAVQDRAVLGNLIYILQTSLSDVAGLFQWMLKMLSDNPEWVTRLREELNSGEQQLEKGLNDLAIRIAMETLRLEQSEYLMRRALREFRFGDFVIPKGWTLRLCVRESHRSAEVFADPARFNPDRFLSHRPTRSEYSPFGASRISCLGEYLTMTLSQIFVREIALGYDWQVIEDGPREFAGFHWKPSSKFRLRLTPGL